MRMDRNHRRVLRPILLGGAAILLPAGFATPALAQDAVETQSPAAASDEIVVTARRTEERLQDVPVSVSAFGGEALQERRILSETDLQVATPGLTVRQTGSSDQLNYAIRGQSIDAFSYSSPAVVAYFNEVQVGGGAATSFFDLESIQVLKGPQGTLFGRNATGGAVLYASRRPDRQFGGYLRAGYGNYDNREIEGALNLPVADGIALRLSGTARQRDGFQHNLLDDTYVNSIDSRVGRLTLLINPGSRFENLTVVQLGRFGGYTGSVKMQNANGVNGAPATYFDPITNQAQPLVTNFRDAYPAGVVSTDPRVNALFEGIADYLTQQEGIGFYDVYINASQRRRGRQTLVTNTTSFDITDDITIKNIFGYNRVRSREDTDIDGSPYDFLRIGLGPTAADTGYTFTTEQWSDELQLTGETGALRYIVGAFYSHEETGNRIPLCVTCDLGAPFLGPYAFVQTNRSKALYAQLTYAVTDRLNLTGGFRYTWENVRMIQQPDSLLSILNPTRRRDSNPSWLVSLDYRLTSDLLIYAAHRGSWRTGGFNGTSAASFPAAATFVPETTYDFEVGAKFAGLLGGVRSRFNIAVYDQYIENVQRAPYLNISALAGNVNNARVTGVEIDGSFILSRNFEIGGAFTYTDGRYTDPRATVAGASFIFGPYADSPRYSGSAYFRASTDLADDRGELALRGDLYAQSGFFYSNLTATIIPNARISGYTVLNARAEWNNMLGSQVSASLYVSNIANEKYEVGGFPLGAVTGSNGTLPGTPRMYGLELRVDF